MTIFVLTSQDFENFDLGTFQKYLSDSKFTSYLFKSQNPHFEAQKMAFVCPYQIVKMFVKPNISLWEITFLLWANT